MGIASATFSARRPGPELSFERRWSPTSAYHCGSGRRNCLWFLFGWPFKMRACGGGQLLGKRTSSMIAVTSAFGGGKPDTAQARHGFPVLTPSRHNRTEIPPCGKSPATPTAILSANDEVDDARSGIGVP